MQKQQYLQGFLQHACKNSNTYMVSCELEIWNLREEIATAIFTRFSAKHMQKQQYLQGLLQHACKDTNIYKGSCEFEIWNLRDEIAIVESGTVPPWSCKVFLNSATPISKMWKMKDKSGTCMQKQQYLQGFLRTWNLNPDRWNRNSGKWNGSPVVLQGLSEVRHTDI